MSINEVTHLKYQKRNYNNFLNFIENKKVIIVGPASYMIGKNNGELIDSYDVVIRIKKGFPIPDNIIKDYGKKTTLLYTNLKYEQKADLHGKLFYQNNFEYNDQMKMIKENIKYIICPYPISIQPFNKFFYQFSNIYKITKNIPVITWQYKLNKFSDIKKKLDNHDPTIFIATLSDILDTNASEIYITGFSFRTDGYYSEYKTLSQDISTKQKTIGKNKVHNMESEIKYFKELFYNDKRIKVDPFITQLLNLSQNY